MPHPTPNNDVRSMIIERNLSIAMDRADTQWEGPLDLLQNEAIRQGLEEAYDKGIIEPYAAIDFVLEKAKSMPVWKKSHQEIVTKRNLRFQQLPPAMKARFSPEEKNGFMNTGKLPTPVPKPDPTKPRKTPRQKLEEANRALAEARNRSGRV